MGDVNADAPPMTLKAVRTAKTTTAPSMAIDRDTDFQEHIASRKR